MENIKCDIYAYDFFDTIVHRKCHPEEILYNWAKYCARYFLFQVTAEKIYQIRKEEEKECGNREELTYEELIRKIYKKIKDIIGKNLGEEEQFISFSYEIELGEEIQNIYADKNRIEEIKRLSEQGKTIIIISDFYMGHVFFEKILYDLSIKDYFSAIFISSDCGMRKSTGKLYKYVCEQMHCLPEQILMSGDNIISDYKIPKSLGIRVRFLRYKDNNKLCSLSQLKKIYKHKTHHNPKNNPINGYAAELLYFISKLYKTVTENGIEEILFCSREGSYMKQLFDSYQMICFGDLKIHSKYFYVSRKAVLVPALKDIRVENFDMIFRQYHELKVKEFLQDIGFKESSIIRLCNQCGIDEEAKITAESNDSIKLKITSSKLFIEEYDRIRLEQKQLFEDYMKQTCTKMDKVVLVDVGWKGTIQDCIRRIVSADIKVYGYYIGLKTFEFGCENPNDKHGILFCDYPSISPNYKVLEHEVLFYERIFAANHGPVISYERREDSMVMPIIQNNEEEVRIYQYMKGYQDAFQETFQEILYTYKKTIFLPNDLYDLMIKNALWRVCIDFPKIWSIKEHAKELTPENFGNTETVANKNSWNEILKHLWKNPFRTTDYVFKIIEKSHLTVLKPLGNLFCKCCYYLRVLRLEKQ